MCFLMTNLNECLRNFVGDLQSDDFEHQLVERLWATCTRAIPFSAIVRGFATWAEDFRDSTDKRLTGALAAVDDRFW